MKGTDGLISGGTLSPTNPEKDRLFIIATVHYGEELDSIGLRYHIKFISFPLQYLFGTSTLPI